jgi:hypothetical protein
LNRFCQQMGVVEIAAGVCCKHTVDADSAGPGGIVEYWLLGSCCSTSR